MAGVFRRVSNTMNGIVPNQPGNQLPGATPDAIDHNPSNVPLPDDPPAALLTVEGVQRVAQENPADLLDWL